MGLSIRSHDSNVVVVVVVFVVVLSLGGQRPIYFLSTWGFPVNRTLRHLENARTLHQLLRIYSLTIGHIHPVTLG